MSSGAMLRHRPRRRRGIRCAHGAPTVPPMRALLIANAADADAGFVGERFRHHGFAFTECHRERPAEWAELDGHDLVLLLGSEWSVYWPRGGASQVARRDRRSSARRTSAACRCSASASATSRWRSARRHRRAGAHPGDRLVRHRQRRARGRRRRGRGCSGTPTWSRCRRRRPSWRAAPSARRRGCWGAASPPSSTRRRPRRCSPGGRRWGAEELERFGTSAERADGRHAGEHDGQLASTPSTSSTSSSSTSPVASGDPGRQGSRGSIGRRASSSHRSTAGDGGEVLAVAEPLVGVRGEVGVERADRLLHDGAHALAELAHDLHQLQSRANAAAVTSPK